MLSDLLRPRAVLGHLLVLAVAGTCVTLGFWQLDRLALVRADNERVAARMTEPPLELSALTVDGRVPDAEALEFRRVRASGTFRPEQEVLQRGQQHQGEAGFHVLTPLHLDRGGVVLVRRGWVPADRSEPPVAEAAPPAGRVTVSGVLERPVPQPSFGPRDPDEGELARVFHSDTARLDRQIDGELFVMLLRDDAAPDSIAPGALPVPAGPPILDERNHFSYAVQWFSFAGLALATYAAFLVSRHRARTRPEPAVTVRPAGGSGDG